jgi:hypothetical protein
MSPLSIYIYFEFIGTKGSQDVTAFDDLCFAVLTLCIGNIFKPFAEYANVQRIVKCLGFYFQRSKNGHCQLTQEEANLAY